MDQTSLLQDVCRLFLRSLSQNGLSKSVIAGYAYTLYCFRRFIDSYARPENVLIDRNAIRNFFNSERMIEATIDTKGEFATRLRRFFKFAVDNRYFENNPLYLFDSLEHELTCQDSLSLSQLEDFFAAINLNTGAGVMERALFELQFGGGFHMEEVLAITLGGVDFVNGGVSLGEGECCRKVPLPEYTLRLLRHYLEKVRPIFSLDSSQDGMLFFNWNGEPLSVATAEEQFHFYADLAGLNIVEGSRVLRRSFTFHLIESGMNIDTLACLIGIDMDGIKQSAFSFLRDEIRQYHPRGIVRSEELEKVKG